MKRPIAHWMVVASVALLSIAGSHAQDVRTELPCSPFIHRVHGQETVTFIGGGCMSGITPAELKDIIDDVLVGRAVPPALLDRYERVSRQFGVTDTALTTFLRILGENKVATATIDSRLREVVARHVTLLKLVNASADDDPQVAAIRKAAAAAIGAGDYARTEALLRETFDADLAAARGAQDVASKRYLAAARTRAELGQLKGVQLRHTAAIEDFQEAVSLVPPTEELVRAGYLNRLGRAAADAGNHSIAHTAWAEALSIRERLLDAEHPDLAASLGNLAGLLRQMNRLGEAEPLSRRALAMGEKSYGPDHPAIVIWLNNLTALLRNANRPGEAEPLSRRAVAIDEKSYRPDHPAVANRLNDLAALLRQANRLNEAEPLYRRALAIDERNYGTDHPAIANRLDFLAALLRQANRLGEAEPLYRRALAIDEKSYGPDHSSVANRLNYLGAVLWQANRLDEAEPLYRRALAIDEKSYGPDDPRLVPRLRYLAGVLRLTNQPKEAVALLQRAIALDQKSRGLEPSGRQP